MQFLRQSTAATVLVGPAVDATDGFTPETGLAVGTVDEIGVYKHDGTSLVDISGTTTLTHRAGGMYTATLSTSDTDTQGRMTLYLRDDSVCRPVKEEFFVLDENSYDKLFDGSIANIVTGFGASSPDTLQGYMKALMSKTASAPTGVGTFSPASDSLEILGEKAVSIEGAGFATGTDSLKQLRDAIDTLVAPAVVSSSALSGSGFLSDCVSLIRKAVDEPSTNPKYTDSDIVEMLQAAFDTVMTDIHVTTDHPIIIRHSITLVDGTQDYILPPGVGELMRVAKIDANTNLPQWESWPGSYNNPSGDGWKIEGNVLRLLRDWNSTDNIEIMYMPNAEPLMHKANLAAPTTDLDNTALTMILNSTVTDGTLDTRENAYVGYMIRILSSNATTQEERLITAYDASTRTATYNKAFTRTHEGAGAVTYEIVPLFSRLIKHVVCLRASIDILSQEGNAKRMQTLTANYQVKLSAMRRELSKKEGRFPHHFDGDAWDNLNRGGLF